MIDAEFNKKGDTYTFWTETIESDDDQITLTWYNFLEPFMLTVPAGSAPGRPTEYTVASSPAAPGESP